MIHVIYASRLIVERIYFDNNVWSETREKSIFSFLKKVTRDSLEWRRLVQYVAAACGRLSKLRTTNVPISRRKDIGDIESSFTDLR